MSISVGTSTSHPTLITLPQRRSCGQPQPSLATRGDRPGVFLLVSRSLMGSSAVQPRLAARGSALTHRRARRRYGPPRVPRPSPSSLWRMRGLVEAVGTAGNRSRRGEAPRLRRRRRALSSPLPPHFQAVATTTASAAGGAAAYCLSPRRRCGAAPARPAGEPRAPHGESAT